MSTPCYSNDATCCSMDSASLSCSTTEWALR